MLDRYLEEEVVLNFIKEIKNNKCYYDKSLSLDYPFPVSYEFSLYTFYDALLKYKIIIDDMDYFTTYIDQLHKLYRKIDNFDELRFNIHKLIVRIVVNYYDIVDIKGEGRDEVIQIIYRKYIENGYYFHGIHRYYKEDIEKNGFVPEYYFNYYDRFMKINDIFKKYTRMKPILKDFDLKEVSFCDDFLLGCYYSMYSPFYFFQFLTNHSIMKKKITDDYLRDRVIHYNSFLKKYMDNHLFDEKDKKYILDLVQDEWNLLKNKEKGICIIGIPRNMIKNDAVPIDKYIQSLYDVYEVVDRILSSKYNNIKVKKTFSSDMIQMISLPPFYDRKKDNSIQVKKSYDSCSGLNKYGNTSLLFLLGILFISLGIILSMWGGLR